MNHSIAARLAAKAAYSYRSDPAVASFADDRPIIVFDGVCILCSKFVHFVVARDTKEQFRFVQAQSPLGQALFRHYELDTRDFETNLLIADGRAWGKLDALVGITRRIGGPWHLVRVLAVLPRPLRDWLYDRIARNRYRIFGRTDACMVPDARWRARLLD